MSDDADNFTSLRPYLLRAHHEWMSDNGLTPHLVVNATLPDVEVPWAFVKDGTIVLNVSLRAVRDLHLGNEHIAFSARFSGSPHQVFVPMEAVRGLVARDYAMGITFPDEVLSADSEEPVSDGLDAADQLSSVREATPLRTLEGLSVSDEPRPEPDGTPPPSAPKRPSLRVVK